MVAVLPVCNVGAGVNWFHTCSGLGSGGGTWPGSGGLWGTAYAGCFVVFPANGLIAEWLCRCHGNWAAGWFRIGRHRPGADRATAWQRAIADARGTGAWCPADPGSGTGSIPAPCRGQVERAPCALDDPSYANVTVRISSATFANLGPVSAALLEPTWKPYAGTDQPISVLCRIRDAAGTALRAAGYLAAVEVPVQRITDGAVRFEVLYARITQVRVVGHPGTNRALLEATLRRLTQGPVFNRYEAERQILLARDIPGYDITLTLRPEHAGAGRMIAEVRVENTPVVVDATVTDLAAPATGRIGGQLRATFNGLTGMGDQTTLSVYSTAPFHKQQIWHIGHQLAFGSNGLQLAGHVTYAVTRPSLTAGIPPVDAHTWLGNLALSYPLLRRDAMTVRVTTGLDLVDQTVTFGGLSLSRDRLRVGYVRADVFAHDGKGVTAWGVPLWRLGASLEARRGLAILHASPDCVSQAALCSGAGAVPPSIALGNPEATVVRTSADLEWNPAKVISLDLGLRGQVASSPVFAFEQFSLGNYSVGRGFAPGAVVGDKGAALSLDLRGPWLRPGHKPGFALQPFVFSDNGWAGRLDLPGQRSASLHSLGGGARLVVGGMAQVDAMIAIPTNHLPGEKSIEPPLFLVTLSTRLWPWRFR